MSEYEEIEKKETKGNIVKMRDFRLKKRK